MYQDIQENFSDCPRCGWRSLEHLSTHKYCINCNYNNVEDEPYHIPFHIELMIEEKEKERKRKRLLKSKSILPFEMKTIHEEEICKLALNF